MLQPGHALGEVCLPGPLSVGGFALNIRLLQGLHQQGQVLEPLAGVDILLYGADRPATDVFQS